MAIEAEIWVLRPQAKEHQSHQALEAGKDSSLTPSKGVWPCGHLDFELLASRRKNLSAVLRGQVCGNVLQQPRET